MNTVFSHRRIPGESNLEFESISRQLYRLRDKQYPKRPSTDEEMKNAFAEDDIFDEYGLTLDEQRPFYAGSVIKENKYAFHVFASFGIIDLVKKHIPPNQRKYLMDGTFKIVPRRFRQLLIIAIEYKNNVSTCSMLSADVTDKDFVRPSVPFFSDKKSYPSVRINSDRRTREIRDFCSSTRVR